MNWQPIETAPKDGYASRVIVWEPDYQDIFIAYWASSGWEETDDGPTLEPSHWTPLPEPPPNASEIGDAYRIVRIRHSVSAPWQPLPEPPQ